MTPTPKRVTVRMYQVGFGDCFVVSFHYDTALDDGRTERHVLIDMGSTHRPKTGPGKVVARAAGLIAEHTGGIDAVVATHRHKDHVSGFGDSAAAPVLATFDPKLVLRPWTDNPELATDATKPAESQALATALEAGQHFANVLASRVGDADSGSLRGQLAAATDEQLPNRKAIEQLEKWAENGRGEYLSAGDSTRLEQVVPGIRVRVLGPPTVEQSPKILKQADEDPEEFWMLHARQVEADVGRVLTGRRDAEIVVGTSEGGQEKVAPGPIAWLIEKLERQQLHSLLRIVRTVDDALNNTSLILLIDAGKLRLLFPGDAQIENWLWSLKEGPDHEELSELLKDVDLYKVGHHGSRNATPHSLVRLWGEDPDPQRPMVGLMSTLTGPHGETEATRVPRSTLVKALCRRMNLLTTDFEAAKLCAAARNEPEPTADVPFIEVAAPTSGGPFERVEPSAPPGP